MTESKSQLLFSFIENHLESCKSTVEKNSLIAQFNAENELTISQSHFGKTLREVIEKKKLNFDDYGLKQKNKLSGSSRGDALDTNLEDGSVSKPVKNLDDRIITSDDISRNIRENAINIGDVESGNVKIKYTNGMVISFWNGLWHIFQMVIPELEGFDKDEKNDLAESTLPLFQKYLQFGMMEFMMPLMTVGSIFAGKIKKARDIRDANKKIELAKMDATKETKTQVKPETEKHELNDK